MSFNRICALAPVALSLLAFCDVVIALIAGGTAPRGDEGAAAHIFQLLIVAELPFLMGYLVTADWRRWRKVAGSTGMQGAGLMLAFAPVAYFHL